MFKKSVDSPVRCNGVDTISSRNSIRRLQSSMTYSKDSSHSSVESAILTSITESRLISRIFWSKTYDVNTTSLESFLQSLWNVLLVTVRSYCIMSRFLLSSCRAASFRGWDGDWIRFWDSAVKGYDILPVAPRWRLEQFVWTISLRTFVGICKGFMTLSVSDHSYDRRRNMIPSEDRRDWSPDTWEFASYVRWRRSCHQWWRQAVFCRTRSSRTLTNILNLCRTAQAYLLCESRSEWRTFGPIYDETTSVTGRNMTDVTEIISLGFNRWIWCHF